MNILFDGPLTHFPKGGVLRYYRELSCSLLQQNHIYFSRYSLKEKSKDFTIAPFAHFRPHKLSFYFEYLWFKFFTKSKIDIVHPTEFQLSPTGSYFVNRGAKLVVTIHDLIHEQFGAPLGLYDHKSRSDFYMKADGYIFVSESTKKDFDKFYPNLLASKPSSVILHGSNYKINDISNKNSKKFLFVGSRGGYKNFITAAKAFCDIAKNDPKTRLVVAGAPPYQDELELLKDVCNQVEWKIFPEDKELIGLYSSSLALLYTSNYEGFGMPLVEAMSQGCIPIAGNHSSIPEVLGDAGIILDNLNSDNIGYEMKKLLIKSETRSEMIKSGYKRASEFNWAKSSDKTMSFYRNII